MDKLKSVEDTFEDRYFSGDVVIPCVRWFLRFKLNLRDLGEMMAERCLRWLYDHYALGAALRTGVRETLETICPGSRPIMGVDETFVKIWGEWCYLDRAVDRSGRTVGFKLSAKRDVAAAKGFFREVIKNQQFAPQTIRPEGYAASHRAVRERKADGLLPPRHEAAVAELPDGCLRQISLCDRGIFSKHG
jgi:transposase-like protein